MPPLHTLQTRWIKIGTKVLRHARYTYFRMAEVSLPGNLFAAIPRRIRRLMQPVPVRIASNEGKMIKRRGPLSEGSALLNPRVLRPGSIRRISLERTIRRRISPTGTGIAVKVIVEDTGGTRPFRSGSPSGKCRVNSNCGPAYRQSPARPARIEGSALVSNDVITS